MTALWLMGRFGVPEPVIGDIVEKSSRRSRLWLWKQALSAIARVIVQDVAAHPVVLVRSVLIGWLLLGMSLTAVESLWSVLHLQWVALVVHLGLRHQLNPLTGLLRTLLAVPFWLAVGWIVARSNRLSTPAAVLVLIALEWTLALPSYSCLVLNAIDASRFMPYAIVNGVSLIALGSSVFTGALWSRRMYARR